MLLRTHFELRVSYVEEGHFLVCMVEFQVLEGHLDWVNDDQGALEGAKQSQVLLHHIRLAPRHTHPDISQSYVKDMIRNDTWVSKAF